MRRIAPGANDTQAIYRIAVADAVLEWSQSAALSVNEDGVNRKR